MMRKVSCLIILLLSITLFAELPGKATRNTPDRVFDEYGTICWEDEKARLDNFALRLHESTNAIGNIIVYDGKRACRGEAIARAIRAKKYLVEFRKVESSRVMWRFGGYRDELTTTLQDVPRGYPEYPATPSVSPNEVIFVGNCKGKVRRIRCPAM